MMMMWDGNCSKRALLHSFLSQVSPVIYEHQPVTVREESRWGWLKVEGQEEEKLKLFVGAHFCFHAQILDLFHKLVPIFHPKSIVNLYLHFVICSNSNRERLLCRRPV